MLNRPILLSRKIATDTYELTLIESTSLTPEATDPYYFTDYTGGGKLKIVDDRAIVDGTARESIANNFDIPLDEIIDI